MPCPSAASFSRLLTLLLALGAGIPASAAISPSADESAQRADTELHLMAGELAAGRRQFDVAARELLLALRRLEDKELANRATSYALSSGDMTLAMAAAQRWLEIDPTALDAREILLRLMLFKGDADGATAQGLALVEQRKAERDEALLQVARILALGSPKQADVAVAAMSRIAERHADTAGAPHALTIVALRYERLPLADQASREALERAPDHRDRQLLRVGTLVRLKRLDEADRGLAQMLQQDENPTELRLGYIKLLLESNATEHARVQLDALLKDEPENADALYTRGLLSLDQKRYEEAESRFMPLLSGPRAEEAAFQMGRISELRKDYSQAIDYYLRVKKGNGVIDAALRRAYALAALQQFDDAQALMQQLREQLPMLGAKLRLTEAELLAQHGASDRALQVYGTALAEQPDDADLLYGRSILHERLRRIDLAEKDLRRMIAVNARDSRALNALGYMLTVHTRRYTEARKLIERARAIDPDDPAITDSLGWVLFKLGKKKEALALLQAAYQQFADPEIAAHLGEVLWVGGDKAQARAIWAQALKEAPDHTALNETIQRLSP